MSTTTDKMRDWLLESLMSDDEYPNDGVPKQIQSDNEFKGEFTKLLEDNKIKHIRNRGGLPQSNGIVERTIQTLKRLLQRRQDQLGRENKANAWSNQFQYVVEQYNNTKHTTTGKTPDEVFFRFEDKAYLKKIKTTMLKPKFRLAKEKAKSIPERLKQPLKIGDKVRTIKRKGPLSKHGTDNWSEDIFEVKKIRKDKSGLKTDRYTTTEIKDGKNYEYAREELQLIQPIKLKRVAAYDRYVPLE